MSCLFARHLRMPRRPGIHTRKCCPSCADCAPSSHWRTVAAVATVEVDLSAASERLQRPVAAGRASGPPRHRLPPAAVASRAAAHEQMRQGTGQRGVPRGPGVREAARRGRLDIPETGERRPGRAVGGAGPGSLPAPGMTSRHPSRGGWRGEAARPVMVGWGGEAASGHPARGRPGPGPSPTGPRPAPPAVTRPPRAATCSHALVLGDIHHLR